MGDHLMRWRARELGTDLARNYDPEVVSISPIGTLTGWAGVRRLEVDLEAYLRGGRLVVDTLRVSDRVATVGWSIIVGAGVWRVQGLDSLVIARGLIRRQTRDWTRADGDLSLNGPPTRF